MSANATAGTLVVTGELHRVRRGHRKGFSAEQPSELPHRPARIAVTLALAYTIQRAIDKGEIKDQATAARRLGVTRARVTQILDLVLLSPDLQEEILFRDEDGGIGSLSERSLRATTRELIWARQRSGHDRGPSHSPDLAS